MLKVGGGQGKFHGGKGIVIRMKGGYNPKCLHGTKHIAPCEQEPYRSFNFFHA